MDDGVFDYYGASCQFYSDHPFACSEDYDDDDFSAGTMCCACKMNLQPSTVQPITVQTTSVHPTTVQPTTANTGK